MNAQDLEPALTRLYDAQRISNIGDWEWDFNLKVVSWSPQVFKIFGRDPALGPPPDAQAVARYYDPARASLVADKMALAIETGEVQDCEFSLVRSDGGRVDVKATAVPRKNAIGRIVALYGTIQDITVGKLAERLKRESEERLEFALQAAEIGDWDLNLRTNVTSRSLLHDRCFGYTHALLEWDYDIFLAHILEEDRSRVDECYRRAMASGGAYNVEYRVVWPDQSVHGLWSKGRFYFDETGQPYRVAGIVLDITARKLADMALLESNTQRQMLETCIARLNDIVMISEAKPLHEPGPRIVFVNEAFVRRTGFAREEVIGKTPRILQGPKTDRTELNRIHVALERSEPVRAELLNYTKAGEEFWLELDIAPVADQAGLLTHWIAIERDITERKQSQAKMQHLAHHDVLTDLPNRTQFMRFTDSILPECARSGALGAGILIDLDNFKSINDHWGHRSGDEMLKQVSHRIQQCLPPSGFVARLGGDEFIVVLTEIGATQGAASTAAQDFCRKLLVALAKGFFIADREHFTSASLGIALFGEGDMSSGELLSRADSAMYSAKADGRNTFRFFDGELQARLAALSELESELRQSIHNDELHLVYQPQMNHTGKVVGAEALIRWNHPRHGFVSPAQFIPAAENNGFILKIGQWVLHAACTTLAQWQARGLCAGLTMAVNVSAKQFHHPDFVSQVLTELEVTGADPTLLKLELTESLLAQDLDGIVQKMNVLKARGITFSLDDFGTGYSSLAYLKRLPLDQLKIDQGFVRDVLLDASDAAIVRTVIALGDTLGLHVIAEGVETNEQREFLESNGCYFYQGYLFSRPLAQDDFEKFCARE